MAALAFGGACIAIAAVVLRVSAISQGPAIPLDTPAELAIWPWPHAVVSNVRPGVTQWVDRSSADRTVVRLILFDFKANPNLRFELYDQDQDDGTPFDDAADYWPNGVGQITRHLNTTGGGPVIAAWNGLFFSVDFAKGRPNGVAHHIAPTVEDGVVRYNVGKSRWTFGVKYTAKKPSFQAIHEPDKATLMREFTFAAGGAQCLIKDGLPLRLHPYPGLNEVPPRQPVPSTPLDAGYIPGIDHIRTSRTSMGWSKDSRQFYLLFVEDPRPEAAKIDAFERHIASGGGWILADEQRFWQAMGVWGAVNSDGGSPAQMTLLQPDGNYTLIHMSSLPAGMAEETASPDFKNAPNGGTLLYFFVRDNSDNHAHLP